MGYLWRGVQSTRKTRGIVIETPRKWRKTKRKGRALTSEDARWFYLAGQADIFCSFFFLVEKFMLWVCKQNEADKSARLA